MKKSIDINPSVFVEEGWASTGKDTLSQLIDHGMLEKLLDLLEDGVIIHDDKRKILLVNNTIENLTGRSKKKMLGSNCHEVFPPNGLCGTACAFKNNKEPNHVNRSHDVVFSRSDGGIKRIKIKSTPMFVNEKNRGVLVLVRDMTELSDAKWQLEKQTEFHGMIGISPAIREVFEIIRSVGASDYSVLITGESGTGKELVAGAVHRESNRKTGPFVPVNCGALPENILESELFGHVRGAFTGAIRDKKGRFELADGGTIFLDEIGELPLHMQAKLLRVLQEKVFERVGGEKSIRINVRIIAATNRDLRKMIQDGTFREDLFYRLCVVPIKVPSLFERKEDIPLLTRSILRNIANETGNPIMGINDEAMSFLMAYQWPGNVRELINTLQFISIRCKKETITADHLPHDFKEAVDPIVKREVQETTMLPARNLSSKSIGFDGEVDSISGSSPHQAGRRRKLSASIVVEALVQTDGNKLKAAQKLGVGRATLYRFLDENPQLARK